MAHPIEGLMDTAMSNIKAMVDVNTVVGTPVTAPDGTIIIPVSTVSFGFGAGGSEFGDEPNSTPIQASGENNTKFGGGCGGGANVKPIAFLVVSGGNIKLLPVTPESSPVNKIIDMVPDVMEKVNCVLSDMMEKKEKKKKDEEQDYTVDTAE